MKTDEGSRLRVADDITQLVGETPILHFRKLVPPGSADVYAKLEYLNPGGSDALVIGAGTAGTFTGVARYLKQRLSDVLAIAVETQGSVLGGGPPGKHKVEGIGTSFVPKNFDPTVCDEVIMVTDADAFDM